MTACSKLGTLRSLKGLIGVCVCKYICIHVYVLMHSEYVRLSDKNCKAGERPWNPEPAAAWRRWGSAPAEFWVADKELAFYRSHTGLHSRIRMKEDYTRRKRATWWIKRVV